MNKLPIGKDSMGNSMILNLDSIPVMMVSYCYEKQLNMIYSKINVRDGYIITNSRRSILWKIDSTNNKLYIKDKPELGNVKSRIEIFNKLLLEIKIRNRIMKKESIDDFEQYEFLNISSQTKLKRVFLMIDDIWDIVISKPKKMSLSLIMIMLYGFRVGINTIIASSISYRNLLQQVISYHPTLTDEIKNSLGKVEPMLLSSLGHELIFTPEDFVFYKKGDLIEMQKYYST
jgi:hypothetical protein